MRIWKSCARALAGAVALAMVVTACGGGGASGGSGQSEMTIVMALTADTMDPHDSGLYSDRTPMFAVFDTLVKVEQDLSYAPGLAESWEFSEDLLTLTMQLRDDVTFHDGTPFNAEAVAWNLNRMLDDPALRTGATIRAIESVEVLGEYQVALHLSQPNSAILANLGERGGMMISPTAAQKNPEEIASNPVGTGPFKLESWTRGGEMVLVRNEEYWGEVAKLEKITLRQVEESGARRNELVTGAALATEYLEPREVRQLEGNENIDVHLSSSPQFGFLAINTQNPPWDDPRVRRALAWSIDRQAIAKVIYQGTASPSNGPFTEVFEWVQPYLPEPAYPKRDVERARELLAQAGHANGVELTINVPSNTTTISLLELMKQQAAEAGITLNINPGDIAQVLPASTSHTHESTYYTWSGRLEPDVQVYNQFVTGGGANYSAYSNPRVDELLAQARATTDEKERGQAYGEIQRILLEDSPWIFTVNPQSSPAWHKNVEGLQAYPDRSFRNLNLVTIGQQSPS